MVRTLLQPSAIKQDVKKGLIRPKSAGVKEGHPFFLPWSDCIPSFCIYTLSPTLAEW
jgi:hypothetical protein